MGCASYSTGPQCAAGSPSCTLLCRQHARCGRCCARCAAPAAARPAPPDAQAPGAATRRACPASACAFLPGCDLAGLWQRGCCSAQGGRPDHPGALRAQAVHSAPMHSWGCDRGGCIGPVQAVCRAASRPCQPRCCVGESCTHAGTNWQQLTLGWAQAWTGAKPPSSRRSRRIGRSRPRPGCCPTPRSASGARCARCGSAELHSLARLSAPRQLDILAAISMANHVAIQLGPWPDQPALHAATP